MCTHCIYSVEGDTEAEAPPSLIKVKRNNITSVISEIHILKLRHISLLQKCQPWKRQWTKMVYKLHMQCCHASHKSTSTHGLMAQAVQYNEGERLGNLNGVHQTDSDQQAKDRLKSNYSSDFKYTYTPLHHFKYTHPALLPSVHYLFLGLQHKL